MLGILKELVRLAESLPVVVVLRLRNLLSRRPLTDVRSEVDVCLTSYGRRMKDVYLAIESIGRGQMRPRRLILWLDHSEKEKKKLKSLNRLVSRGLELIYCDDYRSYKKFYPYVNTQPLTVDLVTADDDVIYPKRWLVELVRATGPYTIACFRARSVSFVNADLKPYESWPLCNSSKPSYRHFATGVSGIHYPREFLRILRDAGDAFLKVAPTADDIWLHAHAIRNGYKIKQVQARARHFPFIPLSQFNALTSTNVNQGLNDQQMKAVYSRDDIAIMKNACEEAV